MHIKDSFPELYQIRKRPVSIEGARAKLAEKRGREFWQSLEELAGTEEFEELLHREFPRGASEWDEAGTDRRTFLKLMGASLALAGLTGCSYQPPESIVPYVTQPEGLIPGRPLMFATAMPLGGAATGLLVRSNEGRPTKVEGNPDHPASLGATDLFAQASVLTLYDPDRSQTINNRGEGRTYTAFLGEMATLLEGQRAKNGAGLRFLTETVISPTLGAQLRDVLRRYPAARWYQYEPAGGNSASVGARLAFGDFATPVYNFANADRVLSLDSNFLECGPASLRYARDFASRRRVRDGQTQEICRLYALETTPTNTGVFADHRLAVRPSELEHLARAIAVGVGVTALAGGVGIGLTPEQTKWVEAVSADLKGTSGRSIVIAGDEQPPALHALAHAMNQALGNVGQTVTYLEPVEENAVDQLQDLRTLIGEIDAGAVELLVIVGGNPVYNTPADLKLDKERMKKVPHAVHLSLYEDETSELCHWHIPETHFLETWSDARAFDGTVSIMQPLIAPLYNGKSAHELLAAFTDRPERSSYDLVREYWMTEGRRAAASPSTARATTATTTGAATGTATAATPTGGQSATPSSTPATAAATPTNTPTTPPTTAPTPSADFEAFWRKAVHDGVISNTARPARTVAVGGNLAAALGNASAATPAPAGGGQRPLEVVFRTDPSIYDGRFANNGWLQELPKPLTKLTWDNAAIISPATAERLNLGAEPDGALVDEAPPRVNNLSFKGGEILAEVVRLKFKGREENFPVFILPGQPDDVVTLHLGYGRWRAGRVGGSYDSSVGFDAYKLRTSDALWGGAGLELAATGDTYSLASTQIHFRLEAREVVRHGDYAQWLKDPTLAPPRQVKSEPEPPAGQNREPKHDESLYPEYEYEAGERNSRGYKWGMVIDLSTCVGCNSCIVACQAENNIPVVGKEQVLRSREMHWLRVDAYFRGAASNPSGVYFMPVPCMHCENAPCEPVCPVHATVHSAEGLNDMVYNRCVGTRYCSNNCPYKVRRFNFLLYQDWETPSLKMVRNPEVSIRSRGVMEKCTYCVQRISGARIEAEKENRKVRDGEIKTACQAACPTEAIVFGDYNDPASAVNRLHAQHHRYDLLADLNTRPRTVYLAAVRNPNPALG
ncbi:MAG TPA: TAT-variant-translocated molybdopterin oxidoreductase [Pyrinomonadaceae bacterium]|nr:TAT-variant-translocated molybdopterin oxidoreductase [Pyrinomonadaceae bacterium]